MKSEIISLRPIDKILAPGLEENVNEKVKKKKMLVSRQNNMRFLLGANRL